MEIVVKLCAFALYLLYLLEIVEAQKLCKVPNGEAGTCIHISKCQPLMDLYKKKYKTPHENMYFQQSFCGSPGVAKLKVCCPSQALWNKFQGNPIVHPRINPSVQPSSASRPEFTSENKPTDPQPAILKLPESELLGTRLYSNQQEEKEIRSICGIQTSSANKIIGGDATAIDQYPWLALLEYSGEILGCGGSLLSHKFILTAAHCVDGINGPPVNVRLAEYNISSFPTDYVEQEGAGYDNITVVIIRVRRIHRHPDYNRDMKINDIALIEMAESVKFTSDFIKTICLPDRDLIPDFGVNTNLTVAGWGLTGTGKDSEVKQHVSVPYVPWDKCEKVHYSNVINTQICAGGVKGKDSCNGDSGGPLMYADEDTYYVVGIISYGHRFCGREGYPATHTNVYHYLPWIKQTIGW